jgi:hypothetical protein
MLSHCKILHRQKCHNITKKCFFFFFSLEFYSALILQNFVETLHLRLKCNNIKTTRLQSFPARYAQPYIKFGVLDNQSVSLDKLGHLRRGPLFAIQLLISLLFTKVFGKASLIPPQKLLTKPKPH